MLQLRDGYQGSQMQTRLILVQLLQRLDPSQTHQALIMHDIVFQLPEEIAPSSDEMCLLCSALEETDRLVQGRGLDELKRSHTTPFLHTRSFAQGTPITRRASSQTPALKLPLQYGTRQTARI